MQRDAQDKPAVAQRQPKKGPPTKRAAPSRTKRGASAKRTLRPDGPEKVDGTAAYADDLHFEGMLHAAIATSAEVHAYLDGVDTDAAERMDGVVCVVKAEDIPGENQIAVAANDQPLIAEGKVRWYGDRLALIAANTPRQARDAASVVKGHYRSLPGVFDVEEALADGAPILHEDHPTRNLAAKGCVYHGDIDAGFAEADVIVEGTYNFNMQEHAYLETQGCVAVPDPLGGMTLYSSMQCPFYIQEAVARMLDLPLSKVRAVQTVTGGAFGGKEDYPSEPACCAALLAHKSGRPVKLIFNRTEDMLWSSKREAQRVRHRLGAKKDGTLVACEVDVFLDAGAYAGLGAIVAERANASAVGPYRVPNVRVDTHTVYTCNAFSGAFRGFGHPQVAVAAEAQLDELAAKLGMSPVAIRRKNLLQAGDTAPTGEVLPAPVEALDTLEHAVKNSDYHRVKKLAVAHNKQQLRTRLGVGVGTISYGCLLHAGGQYLEGAGSLVQVHKDGSVSVAVGNTELGQGAITVVAKLCADTLGCDIKRVTVRPVDTHLVPDSGPTVASRTTTMSGNAVVDGASKLRDELLASAASLLGVAPDAVTMQGDVARAGRKKVTFDAVAARAFIEKRHMLKAGWYAPPRKVWDRDVGQGQPYSAYAYATMVALVEVDTFTGRSRLKHMTCAHDVGHAVFPTGAVGQVEGGVVQGMGYAVMERLQQVEGKLRNPNFTDYIIPSALDMPEIDVTLIEAHGVGEGQAAGPSGAKGLGEPSLIPVCAAIGNAIADAVGARVYSMPFMPERVTDALHTSGHFGDPLALLPAD